MANKSKKLTEVRRKIDRLDERLLRLINERARLALAIGRIKRAKMWPVYDARREAFVLSHIQKTNRGPLSRHAVRKIFQTILNQCRRRERDGKAASRGS
jgi:chorismate mutase-like protein